MRLAVLSTHPVQYQAPIFRLLNAEKGMVSKVFFGCTQGSKPILDINFKVCIQWDCDLLDGYDFQFLSDGPIKNICGLKGILLACKAAFCIARFKPEAVLVFSYSPIFIACTSFLLRIFGCRLLLRAETTDIAMRRSWIKAKIRDVVLSRYYRMFEYLFPIGTHSYAHYISKGVPSDKLQTSRYSVDFEYFQAQVEKFSNARNDLRAKFEIPLTDHVLLFCGKMYWPKDPLLIPEAISLLGKGKDRLWFIAIGDGELRVEFESQLKEILGGRCRFLGFRNQSELGQFYAISDTLVLPSKSGETWGLVVNEALQFGLNIIASNKVGCAIDLIADKPYGHIFASGNANELAHCIEKAMSSGSTPKINFSELPHPRNLVKEILRHL